MSNCVRASPNKPFLSAPNLPQSQLKRHLPCILSLGVNKTLPRSLKFTAHAPIQVHYGALSKHTQAGPSLNYQKNAPVCLLGGEDKSKGGKERFPWSVDEDMENFEGKSLKDVLKDEEELEEFFIGGRGDNPPRGPRGGGGGGGMGFGPGPGLPEDESLSAKLDEILQVTLATIGFISLYIYILYGEEIILLMKDYLKYVRKGVQSSRLKKVMDKWNKLYKVLNEPQLEDPSWLEKEIINTSTVYDGPDKYQKILRTIAASKSEQEE